MNKRILLALLVALALQFAADAWLDSFWPPAWELLVTPVGWLFPAGCLITFLSMLVGGWIARRHFRRMAVVITAVLALLAWVISLQIQLPATSEAPLAIMLRYLTVSGLGTLLILAAAWLGADLGQRLAPRMQHDNTATTG